MRTLFGALFLIFSISAAQLTAQQATSAPGGALRVLDKITGRTQDIELRRGQSERIGLLSVTMLECRYPSGNRSGDAYALLRIDYEGADAPIFQGWMIASAPALNPLDHHRYDVWALRCAAE